MSAVESSFENDASLSGEFALRRQERIFIRFIFTFRIDQAPAGFHKIQKRT
jgi:hypothetical protein